MIEQLIQRGNYIDKNDVKQAEDDLADVQANKHATATALAAASAAVQMAKWKRDREWSSALYLTVKGFDITNLPLQGVATWPPFDDTTIEWNVQVLYRESRRIKTPQGNYITIGPPRGNVGASTFIDGVTSVYPDVFTTMNVGQLGALLVHERAHFEQVTRLPAGLSRAQAEFVAMTAEVSQLDNFDIPDREARKRTLRWLIGECRKKMNGQKIDPRAEEMLHLDDPVPGAFFSDADLAKIKERQAEITAHAEASARILEDYHRKIELDLARRHRSASDEVDGETFRLMREREVALMGLADKELAQAKQEADAKMDRLLKHWAGSCYMNWLGPGQLDFKNSGEIMRFRVDSEDSARAAFMIEGACLNPDDETPCLDAVGAMDQNWADASFKDSLLLAEGSSDIVSNCFYSVFDHYRPGRGFKELRRVIQEFHRARESVARPPRPSRPADPPSEQPVRTRPTPRDNDSDRFWDPVIGGWVRRVPN